MKQKDLNTNQLSENIYNIIVGFLDKHKTNLPKENLKTIKNDIEIYTSDIFEKENKNESLKKSVAFASEIIDLVEEVLCEEDIYIESDERTGDESEACIYGNIYYDLENEISLLLESNNIK